MVGAILGGTLCGLFSDWWGRRRAMIVALLAAVAVVPLWAFAPSIALLWTGAFLMQFFVQGAWGVVPAHLSELSPDSVRGFLPGFGYQCGVAISGLVSYLEAAIAGRTGYATSMAIVAASVFLLAAGATAAGKERRGECFGGEKGSAG
jgi:SHS family lactate transporter-like MFS transporter